MLTIFTTPKPFLGHTGIIQRNALESWRRLRPTAQILVFGDAEGAAEAAAAAGVRYVREIETNEYGTPLVSAVFAEAEGLPGHAAAARAWSEKAREKFPRDPRFR